MASPSRPAAPRLTVEPLEGRITPTFLPRVSGTQVIGINGINQPAGGLSLAAGNLVAEASAALTVNEYVTGTGPGTQGTVRAWTLTGTNAIGTGVPLFSFVPFAGFQGGLNVAVGDVLGDARPEIIVTVAGGGPPHVKVFNATGGEVASFMAFDPGFRGGLNVAVGNVLGGIAGGGFSGGAVSGSFKQEIILGAAAGGSPHVVVANGTGTILRSFLAFDLGFQGGVTVAAGSIDTTRTPAFGTTGVDTNAFDEIIVGAGAGVPHVKAFSVSTGAIVQRLSFFAFDPNLGTGVTVAAGNTTGTRGATIYVAQIVPAAQSDTQSIPVRAYNGSAQLQAEFTPFPPSYSRVVNMIVSPLAGPYNAADDDTVPGGNPAFLSQNLSMVSGDGPFFQQPRFYNAGAAGVPSGAFGP